MILLGVLHFHLFLHLVVLFPVKLVFQELFDGNRNLLQGDGVSHLSELTRSMSKGAVLAFGTLARLVRFTALDTLVVKVPCCFEAVVDPAKQVL